MALTHHDRCFGCGPGSAHGLRLDASVDGDGVLRGRLLVRHGHEGPDEAAHPGVLGAALIEAMALVAHADGLEARLAELHLVLEREPAVGDVVELEARRTDFRAAKLFMQAAAVDADGSLLGRADGTLVPYPED